MLASVLLASASIFHGTPAELPAFVSLRQGGHFCGGSLIAPDRVLTAAHCVQGAGAAQLRRRRRRPLPRVARHLLPHALPAHPEPRGAGRRKRVRRRARPRRDRPARARHRRRPAAARRHRTRRRRGDGHDRPRDHRPVERRVAPSRSPPTSRRCPSATCKGYFKRLLHPTFHLCTQDPTDTKAQACPGDSGSPVMVRRDGVLQVAGVVSWGGETRAPRCAARARPTSPSACSRTWRCSPARRRSGSRPTRSARRG